MADMLDFEVMEIVLELQKELKKIAVNHYCITKFKQKIQFHSK